VPIVYPVKELIVQAVVAALAAIPAVVVSRPRKTGEQFIPADRGIQAYQAGEDRSADDDLCGGAVSIMGWSLPVKLDLIVRVADADVRPIDQVLNLFEAQVRQVLMATPQWGGLAIRTELGGTEYPGPDEGIEGITQWVTVYYRTPENDPYTAA
jgi:hypothetical protein